VGVLSRNRPSYSRFVSPRRNHRRRGATNRRRAEEDEPDRPRWGIATTEVWPDGEWVVRGVTGDTARVTGKSYRCPGCDQLIRPGMPHLVCWPIGEVEERRHWHTPCWRARTRRGPQPLRFRGAPRY